MIHLIIVYRHDHPSRKSVQQYKYHHTTTPCSCRTSPSNPGCCSRTAVHDSVYHTPWSIYLDISWNNAGAKQTGVGNISPRAFRRRMISFGIGTLSVVEQSGVEKRPRGVRYTPAVYGTVYVVHPFKTCLQVSKELLLL